MKLLQLLLFVTPIQLLADQPINYGEQLIACLQDRTRNTDSAKFVDFLGARETRLHVELVLWSKKRVGSSQHRAREDLTSKAWNARALLSSSQQGAAASRAGRPLTGEGPPFDGHTELSRQYTGQAEGQYKQSRHLTEDRNSSSSNSSNSSSSSSSNVGASGWPLGFFTAASMSRLPALQAQCRSWPGPLAVALYVPLLTSNISDFMHQPRSQEDAVSTGRYRGKRTHRNSSSSAHHAAPATADGAQNRTAAGTAGSTAGAMWALLCRAPILRTFSACRPPTAEAPAAPAPTAAATANATQNHTLTNHIHRSLLGHSKSSSLGRRPSKGNGHGRKSDRGSPESHLPTRSQARHAAHRLFDAMEAVPGACALRLVVVSERVADLAMAALFPVAAVRNLALLALDTPLAAMVDVDLLLGQSVAQELTSMTPRVRAMMESAAQPSKTVYVLPTFEPPKAVSFTERLAQSSALASFAASRAKPDVSRLLTKGQLVLFDAEFGMAGHGPTDLERWLTAEEPYDVQYQEKYEPWYIADRTALQPYDERYRGYGRQKLSQVAHQAVSGSKFKVHPEAFLIHHPHEKSTGASMFHVGKNTSLATNYYYRAHMGPDALQLVPGLPNTAAAQMQVAHIMNIYETATAQMARGTYTPLVNTAFVRCRQSLPWWAGKPLPGVTVPQSGSIVPQLNGTVSQSGSTVPQLNGTVPQSGSTVPHLNGTVPQSGSTVPQLNGTVPQLGGAVPQPGQNVPHQGGTLPHVVNAVVLQQPSSSTPPQPGTSATGTPHATSSPLGSQGVAGATTHGSAVAAGAALKTSGARRALRGSVPS